MTATPQDMKKYYAICTRLGFPFFFIKDFFNYQESKKWKIKGAEIKKPLGVFVSWSKHRRQTMIESGTWHGSKDQDWDFTPAVLMGYKKAYNHQNEIYIETLLNKVNKCDPLNEKEKNLAEQMGIFTIIENLKENEPDNTNATPKRISCECCGLIDFSYETEKTQFCPRCFKYKLFTLLRTL